jgi:hypothetical protein
MVKPPDPWEHGKRTLTLAIIIFIIIIIIMFIDRLKAQNK